MKIHRAGEDAPGLAVVLVHYHAPRSVAAAVEALALDLERGGIAAEWCVVDNGSTAAEHLELVALGLPVVPGRGNRGFAAGVNTGVSATGAPRILLLNPDVSVLTGCTRALLDELESGASAVAPRLYWDPERRFLLPVGEERSRAGEALSLLAKRWPRLAARARRRWRRDARRHWLAAEALQSDRLSGAAIALTRAAWQRVGPLDESYRLYFEETDWLLRLGAAGLVARQAARAEAVHAFAHSTQDEPQAALWFDQSARLFRERRYGRWFARAHDRLSRAIAGRAGTAGGGQALATWTERSLASVVPSARDTEVWLELSPNREGFPAAAERVQAARVAAWRPPFALMRASGLAGMSLGAVSAFGRELGRWWVEVDSAPPSADERIAEDSA